VTGQASRADTLARLAYEYADLNFVDGTDAARYRPAMIRLASERAWALSADGRFADADSWLARVDSLFMQFPHDDQALHLWFQNQMVRGIHFAHTRRPQDAEPILRSVADNDPAAINPPYTVPADFAVDSGYRQWAAVYLVDLLEKAGRPVSARYRDLADRHRDRVEAILSGFTSQTAGN
jgi:hypothetical protein